MFETFSPEIERKNGLGVKITNHWIRHAQKMSGEVFVSDGSAISPSSVSPQGAIEARARGAEYAAAKDGVKAYISDSPRTKETAQNILDGYKDAHGEVEIREGMKVREPLKPGAGAAQFLALYNAQWTENKTRLLSERGLALEDFSTLSPDDQQIIAEEAEEPVVREWLDNPRSELAQFQNPEEAAARFADYFLKKHKMAHKLKNNSEVELFNITHKTVTEPFLVSGVLVSKDTGQRITTIKEIGGSLGILDSWDSEASTDKEGNLVIRVFIRGKEYNVDAERLRELSS